MPPLASHRIIPTERPDQIYLDYHASTPIDPRVVEVMIKGINDHFANSSSPHRSGQLARRALEASREKIADAIGAEPPQIVFTSGATESNNLAILGTAAAASGRSRILVSSIEHKSVLMPASSLAADGFSIGYIPVRSDAVLDLAALRDLLDPSVLLVSVQAANNEVGTIQSIEQVAELAHSVGALIHCDAAQALGRLPIDVGVLNVDLLSASSHKCYGPRGIGVLYIRAGTASPFLRPIMYGGDQEDGLRPGTPNLPAALGFAAACEIATEELPTESKRLESLRNELELQILRGVPGCFRNGALAQRLPGTTSLTLPGVETEALIANLPDIALSGGSACSSVAIHRSHVLSAIGLTDAEADSTVRICVGRFTTQGEADYASHRIVQSALKLANRGP